MADAVGTVAVVEELAISPHFSRASPTSAAVGKRLVLGLASLECVSFHLSAKMYVMCSSYSVSTKFARWCIGRNRCV